MGENVTEGNTAENNGGFQANPSGSPSGNYLVDEHLERMPSIVARGVLYILVLVLLVSLAYSLLSKIDIVVEARSIVEPVSHKFRVFSDRDGYIERIFISEGQDVEENAPLFLIRSKEALAYRSKADELEISIPLKKEYFDVKISSLRDEMNSVESDTAYWRKEAESLSKEFDDTKSLFEKRLISIGEYNNISSRLERARNELEKLRNKKIMLEKAIRNTELEKGAVLRSMKSELEMNEKMLSIRDGVPLMTQPVKKRENYILAENAGVVSELYFRNAGVYVRVSDLLCTIVPSDGDLYMDIVVANKDIGFTETGADIKYKIDAFPSTDYGVLEGKVLSVSPSAVEDKTQGFVYHVRGSLPKAFFEIRGKRYPVKPGMTATAELVTERKSIFSMLVGKLKK